MRGMARRGSTSLTAASLRPTQGMGPRRVAETDGNRTRQTEVLGLTGVEDRGAHQEPRRLRHTA